MPGTRSRHQGGNLPAELTSFVGRRREVSEAKRLLSSTRLVTLTGVGGVGKTRLALRVAAGVRRAFADGVWLVELAALEDRTLLEQTVADTVGLRDQSSRSQREVLVDYLRDKQLLLVLDTCEHFLDACAALASELLAAAPGVRILGTSRHALRVSGEHILAVPPLPVPDPERPSQRGKLDGDEAIRLFAERAALVRPGFEVTADNRTTLARICRRLDGLPLAIELAAARLRVLAPEEILARLDDRFGFLRAGWRAVPTRHQTLRAVVDWSYQLCSSAEQQLWARVSVFAGGFDLDAAEAVCAGDGIDRNWVLDLVAGLVDKSILVREDQDHGSRARYRLLDSIRHYGRDALREAGAEAVLRRRHRDYYLDLAERGEAEWFGPSQWEVAARTRCEHANLRRALEFCLSAPGQAQAGLRLAAALHFYWHCGSVVEGRHWLDRALAQDAQPSRGRATALWINAHLAVLQGDASAATAMAEQCRDWAQLHGDQTMLAYALFIQGAIAWLSCDFPRAQALLEDVLTRFDALGELNGTVIIAYVTLSSAAVSQGDPARAVALSQHARALCDKHGEHWGRAYMLCVDAVAELTRGELALASTHAKDGLRVMHAFHEIFGTVLFVEVLAWIAGTAGECERTAVLLGAASTIWPLIGGRPLFGSQHFLAAREACEQQARRALGDRAFQAAFGRGADLDLDQAVAYALGEKPAPATTTDTAATATDTASAPLTRREQQVAELVANGLSNKDIAAQLMIAQRTAEGHVERILAKLGFTTRTQLIAWIPQQGGRLTPMTARTRSGRPAGNLPGEVTSFVGRRRETTQAARLVRRARLVTLTGAAGVGKTRLALRVATQVREAFPDGVWLVELAALTDDTLLAPTVADVLGLHERQGRRSALDILADYLADKRLLLVLDNCEHLLDACAALAGKLLAAAPGVRILATSWQALGTAGEHLLEVPPLSVPDLGQPMPARASARAEAMRLFAERAALARPGFAVDTANRATIGRICRRLDGIPLAIELAAPRVRALPVGEILTGLDNHLRSLATRSQIAIPSPPTVRAAIDWSFALCSHDEQQLWARASVFTGGFDLEAAEAVCSGQGIARDDVVDLVAALIDKSVLTRTGHDTSARYQMLETIRHYGQEQLAASGHLTAVRARHRDHYRRLAERAALEWLGPHELAWFTTLRRELPNLRAALEFCLTEPGQARAGLEITTALWHYWIRSCSHTEGRSWLGRALRLDPEPSPHRAKALWISGHIALLQADLTSARSLLKQARVLALHLGDEPALAYTTLGFGVAAFYQDDLHRAVTLFKDALVRHRTLGDPAGVWLALGYLSLAAAARGDPDRTVAFSEECLALCDSRGASSSRTYPLWGLSLGRWLSGDRQEAGRLIREGLPAAQQSEERWVLAHYLETLAWITEADGRPARAARLLGAAHTIWRSTGTPPSGPVHLSPFHDRCEQQARTALGHEQFTTAFQHGTRFTPDQAIDYALDQTSEKTTEPVPAPTERPP